jgi:glutaredoxin 3
MTQVTVYSTPTCPWCVKAKEFLKANKVEFKAVNVAKDEKGKEEMIEKSGQMGVPVITVDDTVIVGFDEEELKKALKL